MTHVTAWKPLRLARQVRALMATTLVLGAALTGCAEGDEGAESPEVLASTSQALTQSSLSVTLAMDRRNYRARDPQILTFTITNNTGSPQTILKWTTPLGGVEADIFSVSSTNGTVKYTNRMAKRAAPQASDFVTIAAGKTLTAQVNLTDVYDIFEAGNYSVQYIGAGLQGRASSAKVSYSLSGTSFMLDEARASRQASQPSAVASKGATQYDSSCSNAQRVTIDSALINAEVMATRAYAALNSTQADYSPWFGAYDSSRYATVTSHFQNLRNALSGQNYKFFCNDSGCNSNWYAYVYPGSAYEVHLCPVFWAAPQVGTDSMGGTIVHESSHFTAVASTSDITYGQSSCRTLALNNPAQAVTNADSHEYYAEASLGDIPLVGDFDSDGRRDDVGIWRPSAATWHAKRTDGTIIFQQIQLGLTGDIPLVGDFDSDGQFDDLGVWRPYDGMWYAKRADGTIIFNGIQWGLQGDVPLVGDFDSDGQFDDLGAWRPSSGNWYAKRTDGTTIFNGIQLGLQGDVPSVGDFDSDGQFDDFGVWRPGSGNWYAKRSDNTLIFNGTQWGLWGDIPLVGDLDGDGQIDDLVVWRTVNANWYAMRTNGTIIINGLQWGFPH